MKRKMEHIHNISNTGFIKWQNKQYDVYRFSSFVGADAIIRSIYPLYKDILLFVSAMNRHYQMKWTHLCLSIVDNDAKYPLVNLC